MRPQTRWLQLSRRFSTLIVPASWRNPNSKPFTCDDRRQRRRTLLSAKAPTSLTRRAPLAEASGATAPGTLARRRPPLSAGHLATDFPCAPAPVSPVPPQPPTHNLP